MSLAIDRGKRIKRCRNMANLSRLEMCNDGEINPNTLKGWELGKHGGLTENGAKKIVERLEKAKIHCTVEWLMNNNGPPPIIIYTDSTNNIQREAPNSEIVNIEKELACFIASFPENSTTFIKVYDYAMLPFYNIGDYVAGIKYFGESLNCCINTNGIAELEDSTILLRKLVKNLSKNTYNLISTNQDYLENDNIFLNIKMKSFTPIIWHRRPKIPTSKDISNQF